MNAGLHHNHNRVVYNSIVHAIPSLVLLVLNPPFLRLVAIRLSHVKGEMLLVTFTLSPHRRLGNE